MPLTFRFLTKHCKKCDAPMEPINILSDGRDIEYFYRCPNDCTSVKYKIQRKAPLEYAQRSGKWN